MMTWKVSTIDARSVANGEALRAMNRFGECFLLTGGNHRVALFSRTGASRGSDELYLTPDAARFSCVVLPDAVWNDCAAPAQVGTSLVAGDQRAFDLLIS